VFAWKLGSEALRPLAGEPLYAMSRVARVTALMGELS
jgi:hypothetical protein